MTTSTFLSRGLPASFALALSAAALEGCSADTNPARLPELDAGRDAGSACGAYPDADPGHAGGAGAGGRGGHDAGRGGHDAGHDTEPGEPDGRSSADAGGRDGGADSGIREAPTPWELVEQGKPRVSTKPRPAYGAVLVAQDVQTAPDGGRSYVVESRRDVEPGPFGLPWRSRFRLAAYDRGVEAWAWEADPDDQIGDVVVHPSGDVTLSLLRQSKASLAYDLVRLAPDGGIVGTTTLAHPGTIPESDYAATDPRPLFRMKSDLADATTAGWVRLLANGEGIVVAFLSYVAVPQGQPGDSRLALGLSAFDRRASAYEEAWTRVVEGPHGADPAAWTYDELRWREQAIRPFLARDDSSGDLLVGRAWNNTRCAANVATFAEFTHEDCVLRTVGTVENERLPLAVTRFAATGARLGTVVLYPDDDAAEQVAFDLAARDGQLAVVGSVVRTLPGGEKRTYPDANGFVDYDGYVALYDREGTPLRHHDFDLGRGDVLAAMRWRADGIVAVGSSGWDRWQGGMSIGRGADPLFAWASADGTTFSRRTVPLSDGSRHFGLHDVAVLDGALVGYGFSDAPMTHSADGGKDAARTFGPLQICLQAE